MIKKFSHFIDVFIMSPCPDIEILRVRIILLVKV